MVAPRRAAMRGASPSLVAGVRAALTVISLALAGVLSALAVASVHMARRVVTPAKRVADTRILAARHGGADHHAVADARHRASRPLRPLHERHRELHQARLGALRGRRVRQAQAAHPHRRRRAALAGCGLQRLVLRPRRRAAPALHPRADRLGGRSVPGVAVPRRRAATSGSSRCTGAARPAPSAFARCRSSTRSGITSLVVSYRNDGEAPRSRAGTYTLGATEWRDVDAAVGFARRRGREAHPPHGLVDGRRDRAAALAQLGAPRCHRRTHPRVARSSTGGSCWSIRRGRLRRAAPP